ncbi:hypothetical protein U9M48_002036 [Paspalum notatum var. saurae]|uniref:Uncharacterized protein n=1 Tax=Paspalum notatum var. saurae TaxID=547442 RepID=A0AAQ3PKB5_PASNO
MPPLGLTLPRCLAPPAAAAGERPPARTPAPSPLPRTVPARPPVPPRRRPCMHLLRCPMFRLLPQPAWLSKEEVCCRSPSAAPQHHRIQHRQTSNCITRCNLLGKCSGAEPNARKDDDECIQQNMFQCASTHAHMGDKVFQFRSEVGFYMLYNPVNMVRLDFRLRESQNWADTRVAGHLVHREARSSPPSQAHQTEGSAREKVNPKVRARRVGPRGGNPGRVSPRDRKRSDQSGLG